MRLLAVTPYDPTVRHGHAADDIGPPFYRALATRCDLAVYAPSADRAEMTTVHHDGYLVYKGSAPRPSLARHVLLYPAFARKDWSRKNSREVASLVASLSPDHVHVQYVQPLESVLGLREPDWSMTMHDVVAWVCKQRAQAATGVKAVYLWLEYVRAATLERRALRRASAVFTVSPRDAQWAATRVSHVVTLGLGREPTVEAWEPPSRTAPVFVFAGAMWRDANARAAEYLAREVFPHVRRLVPAATLRIVGARPAPSLMPLDGHGGVMVVGEVPSIAAEYAHADAVVAVSVVDAGVLVKALTALECGAPIVMNETVANPLGVTDGVHALVRQRPEDLANAMAELWLDKDRARRIGAEGRSLAMARSGWPELADRFLSAIGANA